MASSLNFIQQSKRMSDVSTIIISGDSLSPLPSDLRSGLYAVATLGFLSFFASLTLFIVLSYRIASWARKSKSTNQFVFLIYNLVLADLQQSVAFLLNARWLVEDGILTGTSTCWAQGWFVSTGDLASGVFCFFIGVHTFASVIFDYRLSPTKFGFTIFGLWIFVYALAVAGVASHPGDFYVRAVAWCWVNTKYAELRLWLHYFWIFFFEFGTVIVYLAMWLALQYRVKTGYYSNDEQVKHARTAMKLMVVYPIIYVICTLPLATLRMVSMTSATGKQVPYGWFCFAGAMITSNGWLDVLLYSITRRIMLFSDEPPPDNYGIETFQMPFGSGGPKRFGTRTTCEFTGPSNKKPFMNRMLRSGASSRSHSDIEKGKASQITSFSSTDNLFALRNSHWAPTSPIPTIPKQAVWAREARSLSVKTETTVEVRSEPLVELDDLREMHAMKDANERVRPPSESNVDDDSLDFLSKPEGWK